MKFIQLGITSALLVCLGGICGADQITLGSKTFDTIVEAQTFIETSIQLPQLSITSNIPYPTIYNLLDQACGDTYNTYKTEQLKAAWGINIASWKVPSEMQRYFNTLKNLIATIDLQEDNQRFCQQKYLLFSLLQHTQELYRNTENGLMHQSAEAEIFTTKQAEITKEEIPITNPAETTNKQASSTISDNYLTLINNTQEILEQEYLILAQLAEKIVQREIGALMTQQFLTEEDIERLDNKIEISYVNSCGTTKGSYHMTQKIGGSDKTLKSIKLNINLCNDRTYIINFEKYVRQIFIHELAHYFYYFKDTETQRFDSTCRQNGQKICTMEDFVSDYAKKNKEEDYAESFAYRYLGYINTNVKGHGSATTTKIGEKEEYFDHAFRKR